MATQLYCQVNVFYFLGDSMKLNSEFWDKQHVSDRENYLYKKNVLCREHHRLFNSLDLLPNDKVFEIGCGDSVFLEYLTREYLVEPFGLDSSPKGLGMVKTRLPNFTENFVLSDVGEYQIQETFKLVTSFGFMEHFSEREPIWRTSHKLTSKNGLCLCVIPNLSGLNYFFAKYVAKILDWHEVIPIETSIKEAEKAGFIVVKSEYFGGYRFFGTPKSKLLRYFKKAGNLFLHMQWLIFGKNNKLYSPYYYLLCKR
jgi:cyclopropane fatty-acyl-phospholipid synthase-like methyltransferase